MRLDEYLVKYNFVKSRNLAKQYILDGYVKVNNVIVKKCSYLLDINQNYNIEILRTQKYVSRAGYKLEAAINEFNIDCNDKVVLDVGASTGGFSDCCLQNGARKIFCVDVGTNQLDLQLLKNDKIINLENTNIKDLNEKIIYEPIDLVVSDISFISSKYMFEALEHISLKKQCTLITLIKPQFELDNNIVKHQNYCIKNKKYIETAINNVKIFAIEHKWIIKGLIPSPIKGAKSQNQEYLLWCIKNE